jgi:hypothetical protein
MQTQLTVKMVVYVRGSVELYRYENGDWRLTLRRKSADSTIKFIREHASAMRLVGMYLVQSIYADKAEAEVQRWLNWSN